MSNNERDSYAQLNGAENMIKTDHDSKRSIGCRLCFSHLLGSSFFSSTDTFGGWASPPET